VVAHGIEESTRVGGSRGGSRAHMGKVCVGEGETRGHIGREGLCTHAVGCPCGHGVGGAGETLGQRRKLEGPELLIPCRELGNISHALRER